MGTDHPRKNPLRGSDGFLQHGQKVHRVQADAEIVPWRRVTGLEQLEKLMGREFEMGLNGQNHTVILEHLALGFEALGRLLQECLGGRALRVPAHQAS